MLKADDSVQFITGVGAVVAEKLQKLKIHTVQDLVDYVPRKYDDFSQIIRVSQVRPGSVSLKVKISAVKSNYSRRGLHMTTAMASDESGSVKLIWFNQPYRAQSIKSDVEYYVSGDFANNYKFFAITNPSIELVSNFPINTARLVPQYRLTKGLGPAQLRKIMRSALQTYQPPETLPEWLVKQRKLVAKSTALMEMHFPETLEGVARAKERLGFEEVFELTLASELNKLDYKNEHSLKIPFDEELTKEFVDSLPFKLTDDQRRTSWQIIQDMESGTPMNRLLEGDVGSGKTVTAVMASIGAIKSGLQVAFMAPTELLANQHAQNLHKLLTPIGFQKHILLLTGSMSKAQKENAYKAIKAGDARLIVGTHALFQDKVVFKKLGLIIVDEQHRFGVSQRKQLQSKADELPHVLSMTATPIPRSLALTLYGEMDISIIAELPPGRKPINTKLFIPENRRLVYSHVADELEAGRQAFVVCPQIEEDEAGRLSVKKIHKELSTKILKGHKVGLLHGKMKSTEKDQIMSEFVEKKLDVLVATTVIEVGVDVPNASVMVIEGADKFGLAQLHQLRGRVGRGSDEAYCYLVLAENGDFPKRLKLIEHEINGFKLADYDLEIRGPGAIYGTMQHGELDLRVAKLTDVKLIQSAKESAKDFVKKGENLLKYPQLKARVDRLRVITNLN